NQQGGCARQSIPCLGESSSLVCQLSPHLVDKGQETRIRPELNITCGPLQLLFRRREVTKAQRGLREAYTGVRRVLACAPRKYRNDQIPGIAVFTTLDFQCRQIGGDGGE